MRIELTKDGIWGLIEGMYQDTHNNELEGVLDISRMGFTLGDYRITTQYYVMGHYSRHIKGGYSILDNDGIEFYCVSAMSPDKKNIVVVLYNDEDQSQTVCLDLDGFVPKKTTTIVSNNERKWDTTQSAEHCTHIELRPKSITTLRFEK